MVRKILIAAGGTGGHLFPARQLAEMLQKDSEILFAGHRIGSSPFFEKEGIAFADIDAHPLKRGFLKAAWRGSRQSIRILKEFSPDLVVGFGSYHVFPMLLAAVLLRKKLVLFEANCLLGKVNRLFAPFALFTATQFPLDLKRSQPVPMLPWNGGAEEISREEALRYYGLHPGRKTILVFGGSQGASFLNGAAPDALENLPLQAIHFTGPKEEQAVRAAYAERQIAACVKPFEPKMQNAYAAADIALCRSGAGTVAELIRHAVPAVLVPYPYATDDHQRKNGLYLCGTLQGGRLVLQAEAGRERLASEIGGLLAESAERKKALSAAQANVQTRTHLADLIRKLV